MLASAPATQEMRMCVRGGRRLALTVSTLRSMFLVVPGCAGSGNNVSRNFRSKFLSRLRKVFHRDALQAAPWHHRPVGPHSIATSESSAAARCAVSSWFSYAPRLDAARIHPKTLVI